MKAKLILLILCLLPVGWSAAAQHPDYIYHAWGETQGDITYNNGRTNIIVLGEQRDYVYITGTITVAAGTTLRLINDREQPFRILNGKDGTRNTPMFRVIGDAKLAFNSDPDNTYETHKYTEIILDGGANFMEMDRDTSDGDPVWHLTAQGDQRFTVSAIESIGALEINNTTIRNFYFPRGVSDCGVIGLATINMAGHLGTSGAVNNFRYTRLKNCLIEKCKGVVGTVMMIGNGSGFLNPDIDPESKDRYGTYRHITLEKVDIRHCVSFCDEPGWGGLIRGRGGSPHSLRLIDCNFYENFSHGDGAVLWWNACGHPNSKCVIDGCRFTSNRALREAGALRMEGNFEFTDSNTGKNTVISGNECLGINEKDGTGAYKFTLIRPGNGGGIQIYGHGGNVADLAINGLTYHLPACLEVTGNKAANYGGGIAFDFTSNVQWRDGTIFNAYFSGMSITENTAGNGGGGIYFGDETEKNFVFNLYMNSGTIEGNEAANGGGIYVKNIGIKSQGETLLSISHNHATAGCGGGIYLDNGSIVLNNVDVTENSALKADNEGIYGGGGLFVNGGSFQINRGEIYNNYTESYGGGVLVYNHSNTRHSVTLTNGTIQQNRGKFGGGIAVLGGLDLIIENITLEDNRAMNGGGIFAKGLESGAHSAITYHSGIIRRNRARSYEETPLKTAFGKNYDEYSGIGGGIYLGEQTSLAFDSPAEFGIYSNVADNGADDLFGYNRHVDIKLPDVDNLNLSGYTGGQTQKLFWAEDYPIDDTHYDKGTKLKGADWDSDPTNQRYRNVAENGVDGEIYLIDFGGKSQIHYSEDAEGNSTYLALSIGWKLNTLTIEKRGMKRGENAIFKLYRIDEQGQDVEYMTVILSDKDEQADGSRSKLVTLSAAGEWKVVETAWSWAYTPDTTEITKNLTINTSEEDRVYLFTNTGKSETPSHGESIMINRMN